MINQIYQLTSPRRFEITYENRSIANDGVVLRPKYLSICAADQRYYTGTRGEKAMKEKLPMALIHEGVAEVVYDPKGIYEKGDYVVMIPNQPTEIHKEIDENYLRTSKFLSSGYDGFMQDTVFLNHDRVVKLPKGIDLKTAAITELVTIAYHSIKRYENKKKTTGQLFGVWGDGNLGFITTVLLRKMYPNAEIILFGKTQYKMSKFTMANRKININEPLDGIKIDHGFECVGGEGSEKALAQMIDIIEPEGTMNITGVSENPIKINTRMILEKGLTMIGSSRSGQKDFQEVVDLYEEHPEIIEYISLLVKETIRVEKVDDVIGAFESDLSKSWGKTVMEWAI